MAQVVGANTVIDPWTVTAEVSLIGQRTRHYLLVMLRHAAPATLAMFAPQRLPDHAGHAEILLVKLPFLEQLRDDRPLLVPAAELGHEARVSNHRKDVKVRRQTIKQHEEEIQKGRRRVRRGHHMQDVSDTDPEQRTSKDASKIRLQ
jgi:hypothetical protein